MNSACRAPIALVLWLFTSPVYASTIEQSCTPTYTVFSSNTCNSGAETAVAGDVLIVQSYCDALRTGSGTIRLQQFSGGSWNTVGSAAYTGGIDGGACSRGTVVLSNPVVGRDYRVQVTINASNIPSVGRLLRARPITSGTGNPGNCIAHNDSGEPNWFVYSPTLSDTTPSVIRTQASGVGSDSTAVTRLSDSTSSCSGGSSCSFSANQGISYLIRSDETRSGTNGQTCVQSAAAALQVSMVGVARSGRYLAWETSSEAGALGFIVEHDAGAGFGAVSDLLPSLSEPGGGTYAYFLPAGLSGAVRVVEVDATGFVTVHAP